VTIVLALGAALAYGAADFLGGFASRTRSAVAVAAVSAGVGVIVFGGLALIVDGRWSAAAVGWGAASGISGMVAVACLYRALAIGPMVLVAPLTAVVSGATPVVWSVVTGTVLGPATVVGLVVVLAGAALISVGREGEPRRPGEGARGGLLLALVAGVLFGILYVSLATAPADSGVVALLANRVAGLTVLVVALAVRRSLRRGSGAGRRVAGPGSVTQAGLMMALAVGVLDATANGLYLWAVRGDALAVVAVIVSLYPAGTIALSALVLRERIRPLQGVGVALALAGIVVLAV
jgi:drug/metabolite transporter (DMT)-like permease